jgi:uncharacterized protein (DUF2267 family)
LARITQYLKEIYTEAADSAEAARTFIEAAAHELRETLPGSQG